MEWFIAYFTLEPVDRPSRPIIHLNVHPEFDPGQEWSRKMFCYMTSLSKWPGPKTADRKDCHSSWTCLCFLLRWIFSRITCHPARGPNRLRACYVWSHIPSRYHPPKYQTHFKMDDFCFEKICSPVHQFFIDIDVLRGKIGLSTALVLRKEPWLDRMNGQIEVPETKKGDNLQS